jgi:RNA polymerase sigma factor (sigma-70 family)
MSKRSFSSPADATFFLPDRQILPSGAFAAQRPLTDDFLGELYEAYGTRLYRYAVLLLADRMTAEDVVQEAFVRLATAMRGRSDVEATFAYLAAIGRNECYTALRKRRRRAEDPAPLVERAAPDATEDERIFHQKQPCSRGRKIGVGRCVEPIAGEVSMVTKVVGIAVSAALILTFVATPVLAHHSFAAEFDAKRPVKLRGTVVKMEWINPHSWIHIDVKDPQTGKVERWMVEGGAPNALLRRGWNKKSLTEHRNPR